MYLNNGRYPITIRMKSISILLATSHKKNASRVTGIFFVFFVIHHHTSSSHIIIIITHHQVRNVGSSVIVTASVVVGTRNAHQREPAIRTRFNMEVGAVIKTGVAGTAQAEFVLTTLRRTLIWRQFESGGVAGYTGHSSGNSSSSPVVRSRGSRSSSHSQ